MSIAFGAGAGVVEDRQSPPADASAGAREEISQWRLMVHLEYHQKELPELLLCGAVGVGGILEWQEGRCANALAHLGKSEEIRSSCLRSECYNVSLIRGRRIRHPQWTTAPVRRRFHQYLFDKSKPCPHVDGVITKLRLPGKTKARPTVRPVSATVKASRYRRDETTLQAGLCQPDVLCLWHGRP